MLDWLVGPKCVRCDQRFRGQVYQLTEIGVQVRPLCKPCFDLLSEPPASRPSSVPRESTPRRDTPPRAASRKLTSTPKAPRCTVCGITSEALFQKMKHDGPPQYRADPEGWAVLIRRLIGVCPQCRKAYCSNHSVAPNPNAARDELSQAPKCPTDGAPLDIHWDQEPSEDKPWRIGIRRT